VDSSSSERNPVEELAEEFIARWRCGESPSIDEYTRRYPQWAERIRTLFPAMLDLERVRPGSADATRPHRDAGPDAAHPVRLGEYRILREVGRGGMGVVYEAEQESLGRRVALKVLGRHSVLDPRHLQRFQREARAAARLHHTNIVPVHGVGEQDGLHYYVMQFIQGLGLDDVLVELKRLREANRTGSPPKAEPALAAAVAESLCSGRYATSEGETGAAARHAVQVAPAVAGETDVRPGGSSSTLQLPGQEKGSSLSESGLEYWRSVARIGIQVADALAYAASQGVLHRDIKPSNLLLDTHGIVWVTDFGLAKAAGDEDNLTHSGDVLGTVRYMAPERFQGHADARSDLYALGLTLYEMLTLRPAFEEANRDKLIAQVMHAEPRSPRAIDPTLPRDLETIVLKAIAREPGRRYANAAELADDLQRFLDDRPITARRLSPWQHAWRWCRRKPALASLIGITVVVVLAGTGVASYFAFQAATRATESEAFARQAEGDRERTRTALNTMTDDVIEQLLSKQGQLGDHEKAFLRKVLGFYEEFARSQGDTPTARHDRADGLFRVGSIHFRLGELKEAEPAYRQALELRRDLVADFPESAAYRFELAATHRSLGILLRRTNRDPDAEAAANQAIELLQPLVEEFPGVAAYRADLAKTYNNLAVLLIAVGRPAPAEAAYQQALTHQSTLAADFPGVANHWLLLGGMTNNFAVLLSQTGRPRESEKAYREAAAIEARLVDQYPDVAKYRQELAITHDNLAVLMLANGQKDEALAAHRHALAERLQLADRFPANPAYREDLGTSYNNLGLALLAAKQFEPAEQAHGEAIRIQRRLVEDFRGVPSHREALAKSYQNLGDLLYNADQFARAEPVYRDALTIRQKLADEAPKVPEYANSLANTLGGLARLKIAAKDHAGACRLLEQAQPYHRTALTMNPKRPLYCEIHRNNQMAMCEASLGLKDHAAVLAAVDKMMGHAFDPASDAVEGACYVSRCVPLAEQDTQLPEVRRHVLASTYAANAVALLRRAVSAGWNGIERVRKDVHLDPLRQRDDFQKLVAELEHIRKDASK
jgi:serine/threonine protein kinase